MPRGHTGVAATDTRRVAPQVGSLHNHSNGYQLRIRRYGRYRRVRAVKGGCERGHGKRAREGAKRSRTEPEESREPRGRRNRKRTAAPAQGAVVQVAGRACWHEMSPAQ